jgi:hypothetical protein
VVDLPTPPLQLDTAMTCFTRCSPPGRPAAVQMVDIETGSLQDRCFKSPGNCRLCSEQVAAISLLHGRLHAGSSWPHAVREAAEQPAVRPDAHVMAA